MVELTLTLNKAARGILNWSVKELSERSNVPLDTLRSFETGRTKRLSRENEAKTIEALEKAGVQFIPENGGGAGVRMRDRSDG